MQPSIGQIPLFQQLKESKSILIAGAGGGFDVYAGLPLFFYLRNQGKKVVLANLAFTSLRDTSSTQVFSRVYDVRAGDMDLSGYNYFPELYLKRFLQQYRDFSEVYGIERSGVEPVRDAYKYLIKTHEIDTVLLVDGGTDSLMFGDEEGLGTPVEDICSLAAIYRTGIKKQFLLSVGFGIDHFHGVSHYRFLENVAELAQEGGFLGSFQMIKEMPEVQKYLEAVEYVNEKMKMRPSIVSNSIASAVEGQYGDHHRTKRTGGSKLWINPLMSIFWCFDLRAVVKKVKYFDLIRETQTMSEIHAIIAKFHRDLPEHRMNRKLPV